MILHADEEAWPLELHQVRYFLASFEMNNFTRTLGEADYAENYNADYAKRIPQELFKLPEFDCHSW